MFDSPSFRRLRRRLPVLFVLLFVAASAHAQSAPAIPKKFPSADKIVDNYLKATGGKKAVSALNDATYEWIIQFNGQPIGTARTQRKAPASERFELTFGN